MDYVFYDLETSGISPEYDQPLQFAAIRTDENFAEKERVNLRCRLAPHILPSPQALLVTGVSPAQLTDTSLPTLLEFAEKLSELIKTWSPAIWTGYNSMKFDEEFLRQCFYQNLIPDVYATQFHGNTRFDILPAVYAVRTRTPDTLIWPNNDQGRTVFKLDQLAPTNGFTSHNAHDALGDVEATIHIARLIASKAPDLWAELLDNAHKANVQSKLETFHPQELVVRFGGGEPRTYVGCFCGYSAGNKSQAGFFDLEAADPSDFLNADDDQLFSAVDASPKIIRGIATNKAPALLNTRNPSNEILRRAKLISEAPEFQGRVGEAMARRFLDEEDRLQRPVEKQIYGSFYSASDKNLLEEFHSSEWSRRGEIVSNLSDPRLRQLGRRIVAFYRPDLLSKNDLAKFRDYVREKWLMPVETISEWTTLEKVNAELRAMSSEGLDNQELLKELREFYWGLEQQVI
ncbi:exodeoxyribonuclease I [Ruegeria sp. HU-ET01832]|uniref:exonuclease domain-containing protein n=1 Tax=Ruegeria sp. HU-ET01832 TaxID=3135906 RepID=UPI003106834C